MLSTMHDFGGLGLLVISLCLVYINQVDQNVPIYIKCDFVPFLNSPFMSICFDIEHFKRLTN